MRAVSLTGTSFGVTLVHRIHLATFLYTLVGVGCTTYILWNWSRTERRAAVRRTDTVAAVTTTVFCLVADAVSIGLAVT
ncbi:hypothetical protein [Streptomyces collinus]|uniref:hypothetical protein n=1 Tax=Streptomyces collinus TaxID=42684 RepID=UPI0036EFB679